MDEVERDDENNDENVAEKTDTKQQLKSCMELLATYQEENDKLTTSLCTVTTQLSKIQFYLQQVLQAPNGNKEGLLKSLYQYASSAQTTSLSFNMGNNVESEIDSAMDRQLSIKTRCENGEKPQSYGHWKLLRKYLKSINDDSEKNEITTKRNMKNLTKEMNCTYTVKDYLFHQIKNQTNSKSINPIPNNLPYNESYLNGDPSILNTMPILYMYNELYEPNMIAQNGLNPCTILSDNKLHQNDDLYDEYKDTLEMAVVRVKKLMCLSETVSKTSEKNTIEFYNINYQLLKIIRKYLATTLRHLLQHGTISNHNEMEIENSDSIKSGERSSKWSSIGKRHDPVQSEAVGIDQVHFWRIILHYYHNENKRRQEKSTATTVKLMQSFNLHLSDQHIKFHLLSTIGVLETSYIHKQTNDSHFKSFVCAALNVNLLTTWLRLILSCKYILKYFYHPWSFVRKHGCEDIFNLLDTLTDCKFHLPVGIIDEKLNYTDAFI